MTSHSTEQYLIKQFRITRFFAIVAIVLVSISSVLSVILLTISLGHAQKPNAIFEVGQYNAQGQQDYTKGNINNVVTPNAAGLNSPGKAVVDTVRHRLYQIDSGNNRVLVFNLDNQNNLADRTADFVLGQTDFNSKTAPTSTTTTAESLYKPLDLAIAESDGKLYVLDQICSDCDAHARRTLVFDTTQLANNMSASFVLGQADFTSAVIENSTAQARMDEAAALALDDTNHILYSSGGHGGIIKYFNVSNIQNNLPAYGGIGGDFPKDSQNLDYGVQSLAVDAAHNKLYVADYANKRVIVYDASSTRPAAGGTPAQAIAVLGQPDFSKTTHDRVPNTPVANEFVPVSLAVDSATQHLFVGDDEQRCNSDTPTDLSACSNKVQAARVLVFDTINLSNGMPATNVIGKADFNTVGGGISQKGTSSYEDLSVSTDHKLYASDQYSQRTLIYDVNTVVNYPTAIDIIGQTKGNGQPNYSAILADNPSTNDKGLFGPSGQIVDSVHHRLIVADSGNNRVLIKKLDQNNQPVSDSFDTVLGQADLYSNQGMYDYGVSVQGMPTPDQWSTIANDLYRPDRLSGLSFPKTAFYTDTTTPDFAKSLMGALTSASNPLAYDPVHNRLFVADMMGGCIMVYDLSNPSSGMGASYVIGKPNFSAIPSLLGSLNSLMSGQNYNGLNSSNMLLPTAVAVDSVNNRLFVTDGLANRVTTYDLNNLSSGMTASNVLGQASFDTTLSLDSSPLISIFTGVSPNVAQPNATNYLLPNSLAYDPVQNRLFVGDLGYGRILQYDANKITNNMSASHVLGQANLSQSFSFLAIVGGISQLESGNANSDTATTQLLQALLADVDSTLFAPVSMSFDPGSQALMVADPVLGRIDVFDTNTIADGQSVFSVINQDASGFTGFLAYVIFGDNTQLAINQNNAVIPYATYYDSNSKTMWVSDMGANRIMGYSDIKMPVPPPKVRPLAITSPIGGAQIGSNLTVTGTATGDTQIDLAVDNRAPIRVNVNHDGYWSTNISNLNGGGHSFTASYTKPENEFLIFSGYKSSGNIIASLVTLNPFFSLFVQQKSTVATLNVRTGDTEKKYDVAHDTPMFNGTLTLNHASTKAYSVANAFTNMAPLVFGNESTGTNSEVLVDFMNKLSSDITVIDNNSQQITDTIKLKPDKYGISDLIVQPSTPSDTSQPTPTPISSTPNKGNTVFGVLGFGMSGSDSKGYAVVAVIKPTNNGTSYQGEIYIQPVDLVRDTADATPILLASASDSTLGDTVTGILMSSFMGLDVKAQPNSSNIWFRSIYGFSVLDSRTDSWVANPVSFASLADVPNIQNDFGGFSDMTFSPDGKQMFATILGGVSLVSVDTQTLTPNVVLPIAQLSSNSYFLPLNITTNKATGKLYASGMKFSRNPNSTQPTPTPSPSSEQGLLGGFDMSTSSINYSVVELDPPPTQFASAQAQADYLASIHEVYSDTDRVDLSQYFTGGDAEGAESMNSLIAITSIFGMSRPSMSYDSSHLIIPYLDIQLQPFMGQQDMMLPVGQSQFKMLNLSNNTIDKTLELDQPTDTIQTFVMLLLSAFGIGNNRSSDYVGFLPSQTFSHSVTAFVPGGTTNCSDCGGDNPPGITVTPNPSSTVIIESPNPSGPSVTTSILPPTHGKAQNNGGNSSGGSGTNSYTSIIPGSVAEAFDKVSNFMGQVSGSVLGGIKLVPAPVAWSLPWLLLGLLLILSLRLMWQARSEIQANRRLRELLQRRSAIAEEETNFISLASHYLNTPITIIQGAVDMLYTTKKIPQSTAKKLQDMTKRIADRAKQLTTNISSNKADSQLTIKPEDMPKRVVMRPAVIAVTGAVIALVIISNWLFASVGTLTPSLINIITQLVALAVLVQFVVSSQRYRQHSAHDLALVEDQIKQLDQLDRNRYNFLHDTVDELNADTKTLHKYLSATGGLLNPQVKDGMTRLSTLIGRLDLLSTIERSHKKLHKTNFGLANLINSIETDFAKQLKSRGVSLQTNGLDQLQLYQSREMLDLVLSAVIDNAIKFAPEQTGLVEVTAQRHAGEVIIRVSDNGAGVPSEKRASLFKPFSRAQSALQFNYEGQGLSLYMAKLILMKNRASIALNEKGLKGGATFEIRLRNK